MDQKTYREPVQYTFLQPVVGSDHQKYIDESDAIICFPGKLIDQRDEFVRSPQICSNESTNFLSRLQNMSVSRDTASDTDMDTGKDKDTDKGRDRTQ